MSMLILLVRHTEHELGTRVLAGRREGVRLSGLGNEQARDLAAVLANSRVGRNLRAIYCTPMVRTRQTAEPLAKPLGLRVEELAGFNEVEFGAWTGRTVDELGPDPEWRRWNSVRSQGRPPGGEMMLEVQARVAAGLEDLRQRHSGEAIAVFSHGDVIRAALAHCLGLHLDLFLRIEVGLGSVSAVAIDEAGPRVLRVNMHSVESPIE
jgi:broad specificity phosphatase PhoE